MSSTPGLAQGVNTQETPVLQPFLSSFLFAYLEKLQVMYPG